MAKYLYKNTHYSAKIDPKRTIKMTYGMPFHDIRWPVHLKFDTRSLRPEAGAPNENIVQNHLSIVKRILRKPQ